jgi:ADP-ribose pyrophosphatase
VPPKPGEQQLLAERVVASSEVHHGRYLTVRVDTIERSDGSRAERDIVDHPGAVAIVAVDSRDRIVLVRQWRTATDGPLLEIPAGTLDVDPATGASENPDGAAARELEEETGYRAGTWRRLASFWTAPGFATERMHLYLATDLEAVTDDRRAPAEDERLTVEAVPFAEAIALLGEGEIVDAKSIVGLLWLDRERRSASASGSS